MPSPDADSGETILHIATAESWRAAEASGDYVADSLRIEGFIHCSTPVQVTEVANRLFRNRRDLLLLVIRPDLLRHELRYEAAENGLHYPHVYGPINTDAVTRTVPWLPDARGIFSAADLKHVLSV